MLAKLPKLSAAEVIQHAIGYAIYTVAIMLATQIAIYSVWLWNHRDLQVPLWAFVAVSLAGGAALTFIAIRSQHKGRQK